MRSRTILWFLVAAAALAVVAAALVTCDGDGPRDVAPDAKRAAVPAATKLDAPRSASRRRNDVAETSGDAGPLQEITASQVGGFPAIDVDVELADGQLCPAAEVYALPAGARGREKVETGPHATTGARGRCRLVLPRFGAFDVGVNAGLLHALVTDVAVPRAEPLRLTLPATGEVRLVADAEALERLSRRGADGPWISLRSETRGETRRAFGRDEAASWYLPISFPPGASEVRTLVPADGSFRCESSPILTAWPETGRAPANVTVTLSNLLPAGLCLRLTPPDLVAKADGWVVVEIDTGRGEPQKRAYHFAAGQIDARLSPDLQFTEWFPATGGVVRWTGRGVAAGEAVVPPSTRTRSAAADLVIVLDGTPLPADPPEGSGIVVSRTAMFDVTLTGYGPGTGPGHAMLLSDAGGRVRSNSPRGEVRHIGNSVPAWLAAAHGDRVAPPRRVTEEMAGPVELALEPGGFLVVECATKPPGELGRITIERKDGAPLIFLGTDLLPPIDAITGNRIGPLAPGDVSFVLRLAGMDVGEVTATVVAGETQTLTIPKLPAR